MLKRILASLLFVFCCCGTSAARDAIRVVGSPEAVSFVEIVAENFAQQSRLPAPALEFTGSGSGFRLFCRGVGFEHPDIVATPRKMTTAELAECRANGVQDITKIVVGLDAILLANLKTSPRLDVTRAQLFAALAEVVEVGGELTENPHAKWSDIDPGLPESEIQVLLPPPSSGTFEAFMEMVMASGCKEFPGIAALDEPRRFKICRSLRRDGVLQSGLRNNAMAVGWLSKRPDAFAIVRRSGLADGREVLAGNPIESVAPTPESLASGAYPLLRPILLYVKTRHVSAIRGLQQFLYEFTSDHTIGPAGYLVEVGIVPLDDRGRNLARDRALGLETMGEGDE
jgi:phosphate transport system substrate-binding protein